MRPRLSKPGRVCFLKSGGEWNLFKFENQVLWAWILYVLRLDIAIADKIPFVADGAEVKEDFRIKDLTYKRHL
jgi:hypothetical protein